MRRSWSLCLYLLTLLLFGCSQEPGESPEAGQSSRPGGPFKVLDIGTRDYDNRLAVSVLFSRAVDGQQALESVLQLSALDSPTPDGAWVLDDAGTGAFFTNVAPNTRYRITVRSELSALDGQQLGLTQTKEVQTRNLIDAVTFDFRGSIMPASGPLGLPVVTTNVPEVQVNFHRIKPQHIPEFVRMARHNRYYRYQVQTIARMGELVYTGRFDLDARPNARLRRLLPLDNIAVLQQPGLYVAVMERPGIYAYERSVTYFAVSDLAMHARLYPDRTDVWVSGLADGKARGQVAVQALDTQGAVLEETQTGMDGSATLGDLTNGAVLLAQSEASYCLVELRDPALDLSSFELGERPQRPMELFFYGPRDLYRPGETLVLSALLRDGDGELTTDATLQATLLRPDGVALRTFSWASHLPGYYERRLPIPSGAPTGRWTLRVGAPFSAPVDYPFWVEEFLPERMRLDLNAMKKPVEPSETISVQVQGEYLYGAPAAGNRASALIDVQRLREPVEALPGFQFGNVDDDRLAQQFEVPDVALDEGGNGRFIVESLWEETQSPLEIQTAVTLYESGGRPVTRTVDSHIWPKGPQLGVRPSFGSAGPPADSVVEFSIVKANSQGERFAGSVTAKLIREDRQYYWEFTDSEGWHYEFSEAQYPVGELPVALSTSDFGSVQFPVEWGFYRLEVRDDDGRLASVRFHAGRNWYANWRQAQDPNQPARPDEIQIALDKPAYRGGDTARIHVKPPAAGPTLVLVESDQPLWQEQLHISEAGTTLALEVDPAWSGHQIYVSAVTIADTPDSATPRRSFGLRHLPLDREDRRLDLTLKAPAKIDPLTPLVVELEVDAAAALSGTVLATVAAVDAGVLSLTDFATPDPHRAFFGQRRYQPEIRDMYGELIDTSGRNPGSLRFGGDAAGPKGGKPPPADRDIVALFSGPVEVGPDGQASVTLPIPDFNGELRLMGAVFSDRQFGSADSTVTVAAPLIAEFAGPRFLALGDEAQLAIDVTNLTEDAQSLQATLAADGAIAAQTRSQTFSLASGQREKLQFTIRASQPWGKGKVTITLSNGSSLMVERTWKVGTRPAYPAQRRVSREVLAPGTTLTIPADWSHGLVQTTARAGLSVSPSPDLNIRSYAAALTQYPYGCLEQTTSKGFAIALATPDNQNRLGLNLAGSNRRTQLIQMTLDRLVELQRHNGAFSMWDRASAESPWLTSYAVSLLVELQDQGFALPSGMLEKAMKRLEQYLGGRGPIQDRYSARPAHYRLAVQSQAALLLAQQRRVRLDQLRTLYDTQARDARSSMPLIQLGLALLQSGDSQRGNEALDRALALTPSREYLGDYGSHVRDLAATIELLLRFDERRDDALALIFPLREALQRRRWLSTQEQTALVAAGLRLNTAQQIRWNGTLSAAGRQTTLSPNGPWNASFDASAADLPIQLVSQHSDPLFVTREVTGYPAAAPTPSNDGMTLERRYYNLKGQPLEIQSVRSGEIVLVHLIVASNERTPDALVVDMLPAGFELEIQSLAHTLQLERFSLDGRPATELMRETAIKHQEYRDDRYIAAIELMRGRPAHLVYLARAVTPGRYRLPPTYAEDMYAPDKRAVGHTLDWIRVDP